jgi:hypothetical protein
VNTSGRDQGQVRSSFSRTHDPRAYASLGSIETPLSVTDRVAFWQRVHERLAKLSNRIDPATHGKIRGDIHSRIRMVTPDEQRGLQLENAEADERCCGKYLRRPYRLCPGQLGGLPEVVGVLPHKLAAAHCFVSPRQVSAHRCNLEEPT